MRARSGVAAAEAEGVKREVGIGYAVGPERADAAEAISTVVRALVESVRNTFVYYASNNPGAGIDVCVLTGGGSHLPASASTSPARAGCPSPSVTRSPVCVHQDRAARVAERARVVHRPPRRAGLRSCSMTPLLERPKGRPSAGTRWRDAAAGQPAPTGGPCGRGLRADEALAPPRASSSTAPACVGAFGFALVSGLAAAAELPEAQEDAARLQAEQAKYAEVPRCLAR